MTGKINDIKMETSNFLFKCLDKNKKKRKIIITLVLNKESFIKFYLIAKVYRSININLA